MQADPLKSDETPVHIVTRLHQPKHEVSIKLIKTGEKSKRREYDSNNDIIQQMFL